MSRTEPKLTVTGLRKGFGGPGPERVEALAGVDIRVPTGSFVSIVGPSGCGKSTLLNILAGLVPPSAGRVLIDGRDPGPLLGHFAHMPQRDLLMPWRTVLDNVALGPELAGATRGEARALAAPQLARFGLAGFETRRPRALSTGMRQRAALLRTFLTGRDVLLLDEPFGALDALTRQSMREWLADRCSEENKTILLVTHDVDEAIFLSDTVYVMSARPGRMLACVDVDLPRPRSADVSGDPEFASLRRQVMGPLREAAAHGQQPAGER